MAGSCGEAQRQETEPARGQEDEAGPGATPRSASAASSGPVNRLHSSVPIPSTARVARALRSCQGTSRANAASQPRGLPASSPRIRPLSRSVVSSGRSRTVITGRS